MNKKFWTPKELSFLIFFCKWSLRSTGIPERQVERWKRRKAALSRWSFLCSTPLKLLCDFILVRTFNLSLLLHRPSTLDKFAETGWRWLFYFLAHVLRFSFDCWSNFFLCVNFLLILYLLSHIGWVYSASMCTIWKLYYWNLFVNQISTSQNNTKDGENNCIRSITTSFVSSLKTKTSSYLILTRI